MDKLPAREPTILIVDDEEEIVRGYKLCLSRAGMKNTLGCTGGREVVRLLEEHDISLIVLDLNMPDMSGEQVLEQVCTAYPELPVIVSTGIDSVDKSVACMKRGAYDYLVKPVAPDRLRATVKNALATNQLRQENERLREKVLSDQLGHPEHFAGIVTANKAMFAIFRYIEAIAVTPYPILVTGETGTGKERFAEAIHKASERSGPFVAVNVAGLDDTTFADTLFGHKKGAFTGADATRRGLIASASEGTLFLDEIGALTHASQVKLLRLIQERTFLPLGQDIPVKADARIVAATNVEITEQQRQGAFRADLYYRLNTHRIHIPPLRKRLDDLPLLVRHFMTKIAKEIGIQPPAIPCELIPLLSRYAFPGNVRELEALIVDAASRNTSATLALDSIQNQLNLTLDPNEPNDAVDRETFCFSGPLPPFNEVKRMLVEEAVRRTNNNYTKAAKMLGTTRQAIWRQLKSQK